jgi:hypothetical protein
MALTFAVTGATSYQYRPATPQENTPRVVLAIAIEGIVTEAIVDTGGVYLLCHPRLARQLDRDASQAVSPVIELLFRGVFLQGRLIACSLRCWQRWVKILASKQPPLCLNRMRRLE